MTATLSAEQQLAALYVQAGGCYFGLPGVDPWDKQRDARLYAGPYPVVAHPPCERWGRYWSGGPSASVRRRKGDDGGCFAAALAAVRRWSGVLEHPEASHAWSAFGLNAPPRGGDGSWRTSTAAGPAALSRVTTVTGLVRRLGYMRMGYRCRRSSGARPESKCGWTKVSTRKRNGVAPCALEPARDFRGRSSLRPPFPSAIYCSRW